MNTFGEFIKVKNARNRSMFQKKVFISRFKIISWPFKILCHTSKLYNFPKIIGPYWTITCTSKVQEMAGSRLRALITKWWLMRHAESKCWNDWKC
jgi:hypothetical protein